VKYRTEQ